MRTFIDRLRPLIVKELQVLLRDPQTRRMLIMPVILQLLVFPFAATLDVQHATLAVLNSDSGEAAHELVERFTHNAAFSEIIVCDNIHQLREAIDNGDALAAVHILPNFSRQLARDGSAQVQTLFDGRRSNSAQIASGYLQRIVANFSAERIPGSSPESDFANNGVVVRHWFNPNLHYYWFIVPSLVAVITTIGTMVVTSMSVAREREQGTFDQLLVSPYTPALIMVGKTIPAILVAAGQGTIILMGGVFVYLIPFSGSLLLLYFCMLFYILALAGFGLLISSISSTQQQAFLGVFTFIMPAILLSGFNAPIENMPQFLQWITWFNPLRHFIVLAKSIYLKNIGLTEAWPHLYPLVLIACVTLFAANIIFKRHVG